MRHLLAIAVLLLAPLSAAQAAIAFVNTSTGNVALTSTTASTGAIAVSTGNALFVGIYHSGSNTITNLTDTAGNSFTDTGCGVTHGLDNLRMDVYYSTSVSGNASDTVTVTVSASDNIAVGVAQYSGVSSGNPVDLCASGTASAATSVTSGSFSPTPSTDAVIAILGSNNQTETITAGTNYTARTTTSTYVDFEDRVPTVSGAQTASCSWGVSDDVVFPVVVIKSPSAGPANSGMMGFWGFIDRTIMERMDSREQLVALLPSRRRWSI